MKVNKIKPMPILIWDDYKIINWLYNILPFFKKFFLFSFWYKKQKNKILFLIIIPSLDY